MFSRPQVEPWPRWARAAIVVVVVAIAVASAAEAEIRPSPRWRPLEESVEKPPWKRTRLLPGVDVAAPVMPSDFEKYWRPAVAPSFAVAYPIYAWMDAAFFTAFYRMGFDARAFSEDHGRPSAEVTETTVALVLISSRFHAAREGLRPFGELGAGIMDVGRPAVFYTGASGPAVLLGSERFPLDPCFGLAAGIEWVSWTRLFGGFAEARVIDAPGRSRAGHVVAVIRAGASISLF